jgi:hypothetical protein
MNIGMDDSALVTEDYATPRGRLTDKISWVRTDRAAMPTRTGLQAPLLGMTTAVVCNGEEWLKGESQRWTVN